MEDVIKTSKQVALKKDKDIQKQNSIYNCIKVWNAQAIGTHTSKLTERWGDQPNPAHHITMLAAALCQRKAKHFPCCQAAGTGLRPEAGHQLETQFC